MNFSSLLLLLVVMSMSLLLKSYEARNPLCIPCIGNDCNIEPENCDHGVVRDFCGRRVCAKGPGESCGGPNDVRGKCGDGMNCSCSKCTGCSITTLDCYTRHDHLIECLMNF